MKITNGEVIRKLELGDVVRGISTGSFYLIIKFKRGYNAVSLNSNCLLDSESTFHTLDDPGLTCAFDMRSIVKASEISLTLGGK